MAISFETGYHRYRRYFTDISALYQKKEARVYTGLILSLLTVAFFSFFAIRPTLVTIASLVKEIEDKRMIAQKLQEKISALSLAQKEYVAVSSELPLVEEALPQEPNLPLFIRQLETLAVQSGVALRTIQFGQVNLRGRLALKPDSVKTEQKEEASEITFSLSASGSYQNLKSFLQSLENLRRFVVISSFAFKPEEKEEAQLLILSVAGEAYYLTQIEMEEVSPGTTASPSAEPEETFVIEGE